MHIQFIELDSLEIGLSTVLRPQATANSQQILKNQGIG